MDSFQMTLNRHVYCRSRPDPQEPFIQGTSLEQKPQECTKSGCCVLSSSRRVPLVLCCSQMHSPRLPLELCGKRLIRLHVQGFACWKCLLCEPQREPEQLIIPFGGLSVEFDGGWDQCGLRCLIFQSSCRMLQQSNVCVFTFHMDTAWLYAHFRTVCTHGEVWRNPIKTGSWTLRSLKRISPLPL